MKTDEQYNEVNAIMEEYEMVYKQYKEAIRNKFSTIPIEQWEMHIDNCCKEHGCMFDATDCPIELGQVKQDHPCTVCEWQD